MAKVTPKLEQRKDPKTGQLKKEDVPVLLDVVFNGNRLWLQTGVKTNRGFWDSKNHRIKTSVTNSLELNGIIQIKISEVEKIILDAQLQGIELSVAFIRNSLNKVKTSSNKTFWEYYEEYLKNIEMKCALNTVKKHKTSIDLLKDYSKFSGLKFAFEIIDTDFYQKYVEFLLNKKNHSNATIAKYTQTLKQFMNYCSIRNYNKNTVYKTFTFSTKDPEIIALKKDEILAIKDLDLSTNITLDQIRDCLLFLCFTGLRYSDAANLKKSNVVNGFLEYISIKTKNQVSLPLIPSALDIINKYNNRINDKLLPFISNQKMNSHLKDLGQLAELNRDVIKVKYYGSERREFPRKLHEVLTTHIGRKSFISYLFNQGMDSELIRSYSGHRSVSSFARYNKIEPNYQRTQLLSKFDI